MLTKMAKKPDIFDNFFYPTLNKTGYMTLEPDIYSYKFIEFSKSVSGLCLEIGACYGVTSIEAIKKGANLIVNDIDENHLEIIKQSLSTNDLNKTQFNNCAFPYETNFSDNSIDAILVCRVLHFFDRETVIASLEKIKNWLKPGGRIFIVADTPYHGAWPGVASEYEDRIIKNIQWPGLFDNLHEYIPPAYKIDLPEMMHFFTPCQLHEELERYGFSVLEKGFIDRKNQYPEKFLVDGRESMGIIAEKF